jgi:Mg-chelatase subunit ChlD
VLDGSGSMNEKGCSGERTKMAAAQEAIKEFAASVPADANVGLQVFDGRGIRDLLPLGTRNRQEFNRIVDNVKPNASTPLLSAVRQAYAKLLAQGASQLGYGEYHLVIVTDGIADAGQDPTPAVNQILAESPVVVQTIGFCIGEKHSLNQAGRTIYRAADNPEQLRQGLADVLAEAPQFTVTDFKK